MTLFYDGADTVEIDTYLEQGIICGVTTNPKILAKYGVVSLPGMLRDLASRDINHISVELRDPSDNIRDLVKEATMYWEQAPRQVVIKVPFFEPKSSKIIHELRDRGIPVNVTCLMSAYQTILALQQEPEYVSLFYNRMRDYERKPGDETQESYIASEEKALQQFRLAQQYTEEYGIHSSIIAGSIRKPEDVPHCLSHGADIVTVPPNILQAMYVHPKTLETVKEFTLAWKNS
jgi:transaldolase